MRITHPLQSCKSLYTSKTIHNNVETKMLFGQMEAFRTQKADNAARCKLKGKRPFSKLCSVYLCRCDFCGSPNSDTFTPSLASRAT
jgi:hypothetical protein